MYDSKFVNDYVFYLKLHEQLRMSTNDRNKFWNIYMQDKKNENK
jgi:hypothetical protein